MKQRITSEDIVCLVPSLNKLLDGSYLTQIYDGFNDNTKTIILKLKKREGDQNINYFLLIESGIRIHTIDNFESIRQLPSGMVGKFRRELKDRRLFPIKQIGHDRVIDLQFSNDKHLIIELYDRGNFILTDHEYNIIYLVRKYEINEFKIDLNNKYPIDYLSKSSDVIDKDFSLAKGYYICKRNFSGFPFDGKNIIEVEDINIAMKNYFKVDTIKKDNKKKKKPKNNQKVNIQNQIDKLTNSELKIEGEAINFEDNIDEIQNVINSVSYFLEHKTPLFEVEQYISSKFNFSKIKLTKDNIKLDDFVIDYKISAYNNLTNIYKNRKKITNKKEKAIIASSKIKYVDIEEKEKIVVIRKQMKFEEYWWIINNGFTILCGKSADDNEKILNNVEPSDILIHGHFDKSPWAVIKNPEKIDVPMKVINYAGVFLVHRSWNWHEKSTNVPYYTYPNKISKSAPTGEYMGKGSRMVHEKNFLATAEMISGLGILFKCGDRYVESLSKDDIIDFGMVMCAPFNSMSNFDFKIKIKPNGTGKEKGRKKLIESVIRTFLKNKNINKSVNDYIRAIPYDEWDRICLRFITL